VKEIGIRLAVDIGGTFTDGVAEILPAGEIVLAKILTTPNDPSLAVETIIEDLLVQVQSFVGHSDPSSCCREVVHGTTLITNSIIERKGAKVALLVTKGTADVLDIGREMRYDLYDLDIELPKPLVPRECRIEVDERRGADGGLIEALDEEKLIQSLTDIKGQEFGAVAVCLLHAYLNPEHEQRIAQLVHQILPDATISLSSRVASEIREFERMSTTVANAFVQPVAARYIERLRSRLKTLNIKSPLRIMVSSGGFTSDQSAAEVPIELLESGPAGGVRSAANTAAAVDAGDVLTFDMGGTTAKACVAVGGEPSITYSFEAARVKRFRKGSGLPILVPSIDLIEIGAGGGSIAYKNELGLLNVGPDSAGSEPGPACYGLGGQNPTVTDADLLLGYLAADSFLGGKMVLDSNSANAAMQALGDDFGLSGVKTAWGIYDVVNENMAAAARVHIAEKGLDPRRLTMVATGGAGPVHAIEVASKLGIKRILFTVAAGVGSCLGFLAAPARVDRAWSNVKLLKLFEWLELRPVLDTLETDIKNELVRTETPLDAAIWTLSVEMRYVGQGDTIRVMLPYDDIDETIIARLRTEFDQRYKELYGANIPGADVQTVTWRLSAQSETETRKYTLPQAENGAGTGKPVGERSVYVATEHGYQDVPVYNRYDVSAGTEMKGPLILQEDESTVVVARPAIVEILENMTVSVTIA